MWDEILGRCRYLRSFIKGTHTASYLMEGLPKFIPNVSLNLQISICCSQTRNSNSCKKESRNSIYAEFGIWSMLTFCRGFQFFFLKQFINMLITMYMYFNLDLLFHLETSKNNKWNIYQIFIKHWLLFFFTIMKAIFQVHKINNNYSNKTVVDHSEAGLDVV